MEKSDMINFSSLEKELQAALEADRKYQRENDAKFRALNQNVASYEEFRDIVLASHLKPLERKDISGAPRKQPWNPIAFGTKHESASSEEVQLQLSEIKPRSASEFIRDWRRFAGSSLEKYSLLVSLGGKSLQEIFRTEVSLGLLGEFLLILSQCLKSGDEEIVIGVLDGLSGTGRFGLNLSLLSQTEQKACEELFHKLKVAVGDSSDALMVSYEAPEDKEDIFASRACPAFLVFDTAAFLADMTIELPCHCKPEETHSVVWYYQKQIGSVNTKVLTDFEGTKMVESSKVVRGSDLRSRFSIRLFSLVIFRVQKADSGHYICGTASGEFFYGYDVDVQKVLQVSFPWNVKLRTQVQAEPIGIKTEKFQVFTRYGPWSKCDRCDVQGEQMRVGHCYVKSTYLHVRYQRESDTVASCGSSAVPQQFGLSSGSYGAKLEVRNCRIPCPPKPTTSPERQALLKFLEFDNRSSTGVTIHFHNHPTDSDLVLTCPGAKPQCAVAWDKGSTPLYRSQYIKSLNKTSRVFIDTGHHLHFRPLRLEDKGSYFCWLQGELAAEFRLGVYLHLGRLRQISDPESVYALQVILACYAGIFAMFLLTVGVRFIWQISKDETSADIDRTFK
ncbi:hypothetical protein Q8A67_000783 [Cirrhinus molitorella]|uniref:Ig-like domain-containing protein n=1 Tax=Cirrhinus molitorella TaxID=172907 RepID=A0AA88QK12_9TELE|nr:hypothetical protein Q8A67_000783 [Cirrhinus molitorella]